MKTYDLGRSAYFWVRLKNDIQLICQSCEICTRYDKKMPKEVKIVDPHPSSEPRDRVAVDLFDWKGRYYLMMVDKFSNFGCYHRFNRTPSTEDILKVIEPWFLQCGHPIRMRSDGGGQY
jgi:hypothetical protein